VGDLTNFWYRHVVPTTKTKLHFFFVHSAIQRPEMDLTSLENELNSLEELHGQGWVGETEYIRRKEELIAAVELAKLDSSSDDESTEDKQIVNEANEEPDASNFENHKNEQLSSDNADKTNNDNYQNLLSTKNAFPVAVKPNPVKTASVASQKNESVCRRGRVRSLRYGHKVRSHRRGKEKNER
jgi:hypothetical protein